MEIRLLAQVTLDGFIARTDGKRDWYLNPKVFKTDIFFDKATASISYEGNIYRIEMKTGEVFLNEKLETILSYLNSLSGYIAIEATVQNAPLISTLMSRLLIDELYLIYIPICLGNGINLFTPSTIKTEWKITETENIDSYMEVRYTLNKLCY